MIAAWSTHLLHSQQCFQERHNTNITDAWVSCEKSANPNTSLGNTHWILYNFDVVKNLYESTIWNINHPEYLDHGVKRIRIDYSLDKVNWIFWSDVFISQAEGRSDYLGQFGPNFNGLAAQHLLITVLETYGDLSCAGFSELKIITEDCPDEIVFDLNDNIIGLESYQAKKITAYNSIYNNANVMMKASDQFQFMPGFDVKLGAMMLAYINNCDD